MWSGWLAGLGCYLPGLFWARAFNWYGAVVLIALEALFFAAAAVLTPPRRGRAPAFVAAGTLAEALRMTWPFGGLPLGGVFLGQANGPLLQLARIGGPLLLTAGVWAGGVGAATLVVGLGRSRTALSGRGGLILGGLVLLVLLAAVVPDGGPPLRTVSMTLVQGGGRRGVSKEQVDPATVFAAQVAGDAHGGRATHGRSPSVVLWPEDVISLSGPLRGSAQDRVMAQLARHLHATVIAGVTEPAGPRSFRNEIVVLGPERPYRRHLREGAPGALR